MERMDSKVDVAALKRGEASAFRQLAEKFGEASLRIAYQYTGNRDEAWDIVQETLLKVFQRIHQFQDGQPFAPWYFRILTNTCRDWKRNFFRRRCRSLEGVQDTLSQPTAETAAPITWIQKQIKKMPAKMRMVFILHYQEEFSVNEIAEILGISVNTVRVQLMKGRQFLREFYEKHREEIDHDL